MAVGDKIPNLDDLKAVNDHIMDTYATEAELNEVKSALDASEAILSYEKPVTDWEQGIFEPFSCGNYESANAIRSQMFYGLDLGDVSLKTSGTYTAMIYAFTLQGVYQGQLKTDGEFKKASGNIAVLSEFDFKQYPNLKFKICLRNEGNAILPSEGTNLKIYDTVVTKINNAESAIGQTSCDNRLAHTDFDYDHPYNIFAGTTLTADKMVDYNDGTLVNTSDGYLATDYIEIDPTKEYLCVNIYVYLSYEDGLSTGGNRLWIHSNCAFYDENHTFVATPSSSGVSSKKIPSNAKYVRLTITKASMLPFAVLFYGNYAGQQWIRYREYRKEITEKKVYSATGMENLKMVMFGDSITQGVLATTDSGGDISYVEYAMDHLRGTLINCGLGGTRMSQGDPTTIGLASFASLCENIVSDSADAWDDLDTYAAQSHTDWIPHITALKAVDWSTIQAIGILYGANDWHNNVPVGASYNEDTSKYDGACAYGLKLLLTKYPHLQVIIFTPFFRTDGVTISDTANSAGVNMDAYGASLKNVQTVFHCPVVDSGNGFGLNRYTYTAYTASYDGTHPRKVLGLQRIGRFVAESIKRYIQPY